MPLTCHPFFCKDTKRKNNMEKILIGKITSAVGLKGEVKVYNYSDSADIYRNTETLYVGDEPRKVQHVRTQKNMIVLKLEGIENRDEAEKARNKEIFVSEDDLPELPEGEFYIRDLIGMEVVEEETGVVGTVQDVIQNTAQDIFDVLTPQGKQVLIPKVPEFVIDINAETKTITVKLIEGML